MLYSYNNTDASICIRILQIDERKRDGRNLFIQSDCRIERMSVHKRKEDGRKDLRITDINMVIKRL
jgi:hypothetical protein